MNDRANILIVDDQPGKLLSLETILEPLGENVVKATSADGALKLLLGMEFAVILVDVCMPRMDGFELAEMIRQHPRFRRTAVIFISAVNLSDEDRVKGYDLGAVDYIQVPIIPDILRAKVAVFTDLYRKTNQLEQLNRELEARVSERTADLAASTERLRLAAEMANFGIYDYDITAGERHVSAKFRELCGDSGTGPLAEKRYAGFIHLEDAAEYRHKLERALDAAGNGEFELEYRLRRDDGSVIWLLDKGRVIPGDAKGRRLLGTILDISAHKRAEEVRATLASIVESSQDAIVSKSLDGRVTSWNAGAASLFGYHADEMIDATLIRILPPELQSQEADILSRIRSGERVESFETVRVAKDGRRIDVSVTVSPLRDGRERIVGASSVFRDISERKMAEAVLARDRATLERMVTERTTELQRSNDRLRLADRMATIGTLSAGLGHDMGNLLLPVRIRLDSLKRFELPEGARADIEAIHNATQYLQRLARSLRLLAIDPTTEPHAGVATDAALWWAEVEGMMRNAVPRSVTLTVRIADGTPPVAIGETALTQIIFNLVQNAGHAMKGRADGRVEMVVGSSTLPGRVRLCVADNGAGMSEEIRRQCQEPFFTTQTRGMGTGLGLTLATGLVRRAGGSLEIASEVDEGTAIMIDLPAAPRAALGASAVETRRPKAIVQIADRRLAAHVLSVLESLDFEVGTVKGETQSEAFIIQADVLVIQSDVPLTVKPSARRVVLIGVPAERIEDHAVSASWIEPSLKPSMLRSRLREILLDMPASSSLTVERMASGSESASSSSLAEIPREASPTIESADRSAVRPRPTA